MASADETPSGQDVAPLLARLREEATKAGAPVGWNPAAGADPVLGELVTSAATEVDTRGEAAYALEAVFEGFLCHQGSPRLVSPGDGDVALLTGDLLYAIGLEAVASAGDTAAVRALADLIGLSAAVASEGRMAALVPIWQAQALVLADPEGEGFEDLLGAVGVGTDPDGTALAEAARGRASEAGADGAFDRAGEALQSLVEVAPET
ncbi:MAG: hypothetical protein ACKORA_09235 [Solirubrobacterales bacterium]